MIDLHMHSCYSTDGEYSPRDLVRMCRAAGLSHIAVTDHNCADGVAEALQSGKEEGIAVIPGIELDCFVDGADLHVLGYGMDHTHPRYAEVWDEVKKAEAAASRERLDRVAALGIMVDRDEVMRRAPHGIATAEVIAEVALADPANAVNPLLAPFRPGGERSDNPLVNFYWDYCSRGMPAFVAVPAMTLTECLALLHDTGGVAVLAHPGQSLQQQPDLFPAIVRHGMEGVEAYSSYHSPETCAFWREAAEHAGLFVTCGSDFHGKTKPAIQLGGHGAGKDMQLPL